MIQTPSYQSANQNVIATEQREFAAIAQKHGHTSKSIGHDRIGKLHKLANFGVKLSIAIKWIIHLVAIFFILFHYKLICYVL